MLRPMTMMLVKGHLMDLGGVFIYLVYLACNKNRMWLNMLAVSQAAKLWSSSPPQIRTFIEGVKKVEFSSLGVFFVCHNFKGFLKFNELI